MFLGLEKCKIWRVIRRPRRILPDQLIFVLFEVFLFYFLEAGAETRIPVRENLYVGVVLKGTLVLSLG